MFHRSRTLINFRMRLAYAEALPQLVVLGILSGLATGGLIILFRLAIDLPLEALLPGADAENFEELDPLLRLVLPLAGALLILLFLWRRVPAERKVGVVHVLERLGYHQARLPFSNLVTQFVGGTLAIWSGQSVGREGPSIHLGAACSSLLGQWLKVPNNSLRILVGCGTAAAISAGFNTPLAGVVFAMEVVLIEYTIVGFTPVIVSAVTAALLIQLTYGAEPAFVIPALKVENLGEIVFVIAVGLVIGVMAAGFNALLARALQFSGSALYKRLLFAGAATGVVAFFVPEVMGIGYDTISDIMHGQLGIGLLIAVLLAKWLLTPVVIGLGIPGGLIAPALMIGAAAGAVLGLLAGAVDLMPVSDVGIYAMLGMGSMMGAVLNAPLAALVALLELTGNPNIIFPAMIAIVTSNLTVRYGFKLPSAFQVSLQAQGLDHRDEPLSQALSRSGVGSQMSRSFVVTGRSIERTTAQVLLAGQPDWLLVADGGAPLVVLLPGDLDSYLQHDATSEATVDLLEIPGLRHDIRRLVVSATLKEALDLMNRESVDALYVENYFDEIVGVITRSQIEDCYTQRRG